MSCRCPGPAFRRARPYWLLILWLLSLFFGEYAVHHYYMARCSWPAPESRQAPPRPLSFSPLSNHSEPLTIQVAILSDPQLTDEYSYPWLPKWINALVMHASDMYMKYSYQLLLAYHRPDLVVFLGDLMDGGREWSESQFLAELERFKNVFPLPPSTSRPHSRPLVHQEPRYHIYIPGNHDTGINPTLLEHQVERFEKYFGPIQEEIPIGRYHSLISLFTLALDGLPVPRSNAYQSTVRSFVNALARPDNEPATRHDLRTRILLSHVPFGRPSGDMLCRGLRHNGDRIPLGYGYQYHNYVSESESNWIMRTVRPDCIFSGDDHDICYYEHHLPLDATLHATTLNSRSTLTVPEWTVATCSMLQGNVFPSFGMLSLLPVPPVLAPSQTFSSLPDDSDASDGPAASVVSNGFDGYNHYTGSNFQYTNCFLPPKLFIYVYYIVLIVFTLFYLVLYCILSRCTKFAYAKLRNRSESFTLPK